MIIAIILMYMLKACIVDFAYISFELVLESFLSPHLSTTPSFSLLFSFLSPSGPTGGGAPP